MFFIDNLHFDQNGLIPAIAQDWVDGAVLMMAWMNKESITKTLESVVQNHVAPMIKVNRPL